LTMGKKVLLGLLSGMALVLVGCQTSIPPKIQVRDVDNGKTYTTYQTWGHVGAGRVGYEFTDLDTGKKISVPNYQLTEISEEKSVPKDSAEAKAYKEEAARMGIKVQE